MGKDKTAISVCISEQLSRNKTAVSGCAQSAIKLQVMSPVAPSGDELVRRSHSDQRLQNVAAAAVLNAMKQLVVGVFDQLGGRGIVCQWRNDGVAAASSDGGPTGGREPPTVLEFLAINFSSPDLRK